MGVDDQRRVRLVCPQQPVERVSHRAELVAVQLALAVGRGVAGGEQQLVPFAQGDLQLLRQVKHHPRAWSARPFSTKLR